MKPSSAKHINPVFPRSITCGLAIATTLSLLALTYSSPAATLHVPADYGTIQAAVNAAAPSGDEILIAPGVYQQQVFITQKKLTFTGSPGTVLQAWNGMSWRSEGQPHYTLVEIRAGADVVLRNVKFDGQRLADSMPNREALFQSVWFYGASVRVENCVFTGYRGANNLASPSGPGRGGMGCGLVVFAPVSSGSGVIHVKVLNCAFSDNGISMVFAGDFGPVGLNNPTLLRTTFVVEGNTIAGVGPTELDYQDGIQVYQGASGIIKSNRIIDHCHTSGGNWFDWSSGINAFPVAGNATPLKPLRIEGNTFVGNQTHVGLFRGDNAQIINNDFDATGSTVPSAGIWLTGANVLTAINVFNNLDTGVHLAANNSRLPNYFGVSVNPSLLANQFCSVGLSVAMDAGVVNIHELSSEYCPFPPAGYGNLTCSPATCLAGTTVTLSGTNLAGASAVLFNGLSAEFTPGTDPDKAIVATVPPHATTGPVTVITPTGNITSLTSITVPVSLAMRLPDPNQVELSWSADASDLLLETTSDLGQPDWQTVPTSPSLDTERVIWRGPKGNGSQFFRLRQP